MLMLLLPLHAEKVRSWPHSCPAITHCQPLAYRCRARIQVGAPAALTADRIVQQLADADPSIRVWRAGLSHGYFELDPRTITDAEMLMICRTIRMLMQAEQQAASA